MASSSDPVSIGVAGLGGYALSVRVNLLHEMSLAHPAARMAAVCDPDLSAHADVVADLKSRGIHVSNNIDEMLQQPTDAVWLPLPIDLHRPMTERALRAGKAVMSEKPPAGCVDDLDAMRRARDAARLPVAIGYQDIYQTSTMRLKRLLLDGAIGRITNASVCMLWSRGARYYNRASWAGKFKRDGTWVMDSPANNAMAHYINLPLYLMGSSIAESAQPVKVEAELYRGNPAIENFDTMSLRVHLPNGATLLANYSHACRGLSLPITIRGEKGTVRRSNEEVVVESRDRGVVEKFPHDPSTGMYVALGNIIKRFAALVRNVPDETRGVATLENTRPHLVCVNGASEATEIIPVPESHTEFADIPGTTDKVVAIKDIENIMRQCDERGQMLHESGLVPWSQPAGVLDVGNYSHFKGPKGVSP